MDPARLLVCLRCNCVWDLVARAVGHHLHRKCRPPVGTPNHLHRKIHILGTLFPPLFALFLHVFGSAPPRVLSLLLLLAPLDCSKHHSSCHWFPALGRYAPSFRPVGSAHLLRACLRVRSSVGTSTRTLALIPHSSLRTSLSRVVLRL